MKSKLFKLSEYYLILLLLLAGYTPPFSFNPFLLGMAIIVLLQVILKFRATGLFIGLIFFTANLFFLGAVISELLEFNEYSWNAVQLLVGGLAIWVLNFLMSSMMFYKYAIKEESAKNSFELDA